MQTRLTPVWTVFDSQDTAQDDGGLFSLRSLSRLLKPVIQVQNDRGGVIYKTGDFYSSVLPFFLIGAILVIVYLIIRGVLK